MNHPGGAKSADFIQPIIERQLPTVTDLMETTMECGPQKTMQQPMP